MNKGLLFISIMLCAFTLTIFPQTGTFNFTSASQNGETITQTVSGVVLNTYSDHSLAPYPSMTLQDWSAYPPFDANVATMNGQSKPSLSIVFNQAVNISSLLVADFNGITKLRFTFYT